MRAPFKKDLISHGGSYSYAPSLHPSPELYKFTWQVFTLDSELEGDAFLRHGPRLSTAPCLAWLDELRRTSTPYIFYGSGRPRRFPGMPFDPGAAKWKDARWAPALDEDPDPEWNGRR